MRNNFVNHQVFPRPACRFLVPVPRDRQTKVREIMSQSLALVGIGKIARKQHIPSIAAIDGLSLVATASRNRAATVDGAEAFPDLTTLLAARDDVTAISLATPPGARFGDALAALRAGKHVMLEKPPGSTLSEVETLVSEAKAQGVTLFASWHSREAAGVKMARDWLKPRRLTTFRITWTEDVRDWHPGQDWVWSAGNLGVFDAGTNALSVMTAILPAPVHLASATLAFPENRDTPITADLVFDSPAEITAHFDWSQPGDAHWAIEIETTDGAARLTRGGARFETDDGVKVDAEDAEYKRLYANFLALIDVGRLDVDLSPMRHVADAFLLGRRVQVAPFHW